MKRGDHLTGQQVEALDGWQLVEGVAADMGSRDTCSLEFHRCVVCFTLSSLGVLFKYW